MSRRIRMRLGILVGLLRTLSLVQVKLSIEKNHGYMDMTCAQLCGRQFC